MHHSCHGVCLRRTKPSKWRGHVRNNHTLETGGECGEKALDTVSLDLHDDSSMSEQITAGRSYY